MRKVVFGIFDRLLGKESIKAEKQDFDDDPYWYEKVDKDVISKICNVKSIIIERRQVSQKIESCQFVNMGNGEKLFVAWSESADLGRSYLKLILAQKGKKTTRQNPVAGYDSVYFEQENKRTILVVGEKRSFHFVSSLLSYDQLVKIAQHFADKKLF